MDLKRWEAVSPIDRNVASGACDAGDSRRNDAKRFDRIRVAEVIHECQVSGGKVDGKKFATCVAGAFEKNQLEPVNAIGLHEEIAQGITSGAAIVKEP